MTHLPGLTFDLGETIEILRDTVSGGYGGTNRSPTRSPRASARCACEIRPMLIGRELFSETM